MAGGWGGDEGVYCTLGLTIHSGMLIGEEFQIKI